VDLVDTIGVAGRPPVAPALRTTILALQSGDDPGHECG
jgi:hypothetical protein